MNTSRSRHKNVYLPDIIVGASFQILDVLKYACGLNLHPAAISNKYPIFGDGFCERHKNVYLPDIIVGASVQILDVPKYACGLNLRPAAISNKYPIFGDGFCERHKMDDRLFKGGSGDN